MYTWCSWTNSWNQNWIPIWFYFLGFQFTKRTFIACEYTIAVYLFSVGGKDNLIIHSMYVPELHFSHENAANGF